MDMYNIDLTTADPEVSKLQAAMDVYAKYHGPLALSACIVGVFMNLTIILVLSHREMLSPFNRILQAIGKVIE